MICPGNRPARSCRPAGSGGSRAARRGSAAASAARTRAQRRQVGAVDRAGIAQARSARWRCARCRRTRRGREPSQSRSTSPEGSFQGMPVSCTRRPGAWPTISRRALRPTRNTGRGSNGSVGFAQRAGARLGAHLARPGERNSHPPYNRGPCPRRSPRCRRSTGGTQGPPIRCAAYFSEQALIRYRVRIELAWLQALAAERAHPRAEAVLPEDRRRLRAAGRRTSPSATPSTSRTSRPRPTTTSRRSSTGCSAQARRRTPRRSARSSSSTSPAPPRTSTTCPTR